MATLFAGSLCSADRVVCRVDAICQYARGPSSHRSAPALFLDVTVFGNHFTDTTNSLRRKILLHFSPPSCSTCSLEF